MKILKQGFLINKLADFQVAPGELDRYQDTLFIQEQHEPNTISNRGEYVYSVAVLNHKRHFGTKTGFCSFDICTTG